MPLIETTGSGSAKALGLNSASSAVNYIEDVFSTWLYASTSGTNNQIVNGIDLSTKGGMVWIKSRTRASTNNYVLDTTRGSSSGNSNALVTNTTAAQSSGPNLDYLTFNNNGFTANAVSGGGELGTNTYYGDLVSWTFRKQAKFFDVVTYTGTGSAQTINHNLGSVPGCMIIKRTDSSASWGVYHRSLQTTPGLENKGIVYLDLTNAVSYGSSPWSNTAPTATQFTVGFAAETNASGATYVAYLFAHNAGGFGLAGSDNVISCGSYDAGAGADITVDLGYEPQWALVKRTDTTGNWFVYDTMRGFGSVNPTTGGFGAWLFANLTDAETTSTGSSRGIYARGLDFTGQSGQYIYIAIRRGPMKTPTSGTSVFASSAWSATASVTTDTAPTFPVDLGFSKARAAATQSWDWQDRLRGATKALYSDSTSAETAEAGSVTAFPNTGVTLGADAFAGYWNQPSSRTFGHFFFGRSPSFFDVVCYTGTGVARTINHNLGVAPEMMIIKDRTPGGNEWAVYAAPLGNQAWLSLNRDFAATTSNPIWNNTTPTSSVFSVGVSGDVNGSGYTLVAYLFASCPGVSKVGSYSGTGATQTISCGFAARFVMIKRTDSTGNWWVWDTARGMVAGTDPRLALNSTAIETNANWVYTNASGFQIVTTDATVNASGGSYIYLAIA